MRVPLILIVVVLSFSASGQERLQPAKRYSEGEVIFAPVLGLKTKIPNGWYGVLPRDTEIFLLMPLNGSGEIYVAGDSISLDQMKNGWIRGLDLGNGNQIMSDGNFAERNGALTSNITSKVKTMNNRGYIEGKCSEYNRCIVAMLIAPAAEMETLKAGVMEFMDNVEFEAPSRVGLYDTFDWQENLTNKRLLHQTSIKGGQAENEIRLCEDGTFYMNLKRSGALKAEAKQYKGKNNGTWEAPSVGPNGKLILKFDKGLPELSVDLRIENDQIFINDRRYFMMYGQTCRK